MATGNIFEDLAAIVLPFPSRDELGTDPPEMADDGFGIRAYEIERERKRFVKELIEDCTDHTDDGSDVVNDEEALLRELARARDDIEEAQSRLRRLIAYGREFQGRRPFPLSWLAEEAGMSISGVRTAYGRSDVERVAQLLDRPAPPA